MPRKSERCHDTILFHVFVFFSWLLQEIQRVAKMQRDSSTGSTMQEINFWLGMDKAGLVICRSCPDQGTT